MLAATAVSHRQVIIAADNYIYTASLHALPARRDDMPPDAFRQAFFMIAALSFCQGR